MSHQILLADSNIQILEALGDYLEELGFSVHRASCGKDAQRIITKENLSLAILAIGLKNPSCKELFSLAKESSSSPQIILLAEEFEYSDATKLSTAGAFDFLIKPFDEKQFEKAVQMAVKTHQVVYSKSVLVRQLITRTKKLESLTVEQAKRLAELHSLKEETALALNEHNTLIEKVDQLHLALKNKDQSIADSKARLSEMNLLPPIQKIPLHRKGIIGLSCGIGLVLLYPALLPGNVLKNFPNVSLSGSTLSAFAFLLSLAFLCIAVYISLYTLGRIVYHTAESSDEQPFIVRVLKSTNSIAPALILLLQGYTLHFLYSGFEAAQKVEYYTGTNILLGTHSISESTLSRGITLLMLSILLMFVIILQEIAFLRYSLKMLYDKYSQKSSTKKLIQSL